MLIATWNVNSIKARLDRALMWLEKVSPDIVCLQELKVTDDNFPYDEIRAAGYHAAVHGQKTYNGVAILSRSKPADVTFGFDDDDEDIQARAITATIGGIRIMCLYVPNGQSVGSDKWEYKTKWYARLRSYLDREFSNEQPLLLCGDFNVAPEHADLANPEKWVQSVLFHPDARTMLRSVTDWGLVDTMRLHHVGQGPYSWWDYRMLAFPKGDGVRIDHVFATQALADRCTNAWVDRDERKGQKPSDHAPVLAMFDG
jgi:exodeoxyribonuclease-3